MTNRQGDVLARGEAQRARPEPEDTVRQAIELAAADLFRLQGYQATRMSDVAARADVSPTSIYAKFASKRTLYEAVVGSPPPEALEAGSRATARGRRTRERLLSAGRQVFERDGYVESRVADVCEIAGVAAATFYTYFEAKGTFFREIVIAAAGDLLGSVFAPVLSPDGGDRTPALLTRTAVSRYLGSYADNGRLLVVLDEAAVGLPALADLRRAIRAPFLQKLTRAVDGWQRAGLAASGIAPESVADALLAMVERTAALNAADPADPMPLEDLTQALSLLVLRAVGVDDDVR